MSTRVAPVSVVICTRDRANDLARCLESVARLDPQPAEVIVVDQGAAPFSPPVGGPAVRHLRSHERGLSLARNLGLAAASADFIAFLDDDCAVGPTWAADVAAVFTRHPDAGLAFGAVVDPGSDHDAYVPVYSIARERRLAGRMSARRAHGIGAAMYLRATAAAAIGAFDPWLGAGAEFRSSEDWDYTFRALAAGVVVVETPAVVVQHFGARRFSDGSAAQLLRWNAFSHGAVHAKLLRCGDPVGLVLVTSEVASVLALVRPLNALARRPTNAARLVMYVRGLKAGLSIPVRRSERLFGRAEVRTPA